jgi:hypothetical protein
VQAAAAAALAQAADHLQPLEPALLRQLLRNLSNPLFLGRGELCGAIARLEGGLVRGLVASSCQQLLGAMPEVLGSMTGGRFTVCMPCLAVHEQHSLQACSQQLRC